MTTAINLSFPDGRIKFERVIVFVAAAKFHTPFPSETTCPFNGKVNTTEKSKQHKSVKRELVFFLKYILFMMRSFESVMGNKVF
jgi:hypothetical protein